MKHDPARWDEYFEAAKGLGPNPFYGTVESVLGSDFSGQRVLELGFGAGAGVGWWLDRGAEVVAVDEDPRMCAHLSGLVGDGVEVVCGGFEEGFLRGPFDVVSAVFSLFFVAPKELAGLWESVWGCLKPGGVFVGQLIGPEDDWAREGFAAVSREELEGILVGKEVLYLEEVRRRGKTVFGLEKEWDVYHLVVRG